MSTGVFDARFNVSFGWDFRRKCWVVQVRETAHNYMVMKRDVHCTASLARPEQQRIMRAITREMESWLPYETA